MMTPPIDAGLEAYVTRLFPKLNPIEQQISIALYRLLAEGRPVARGVLAAQVGLSPALVREVLDNWYGVYYDAAGEIVGYRGLALKETSHRFRVRGRTLYAWCAWDTLFIPQILGVAAEIESNCPVSGDAIRLIVTPYGVEAVEPASTVISFVTPQQAELRENIALHFCHFIHFFRSEGIAGDWIVRHPGTRILTLDKAWALGREKNADQYDAVADIQDRSPAVHPMNPFFCCAK